MKDKLKKIIGGLVAGILLVSAILPFNAEAATVGELNELIDGIVAYEEKTEDCSDAEEWIKALEATAGSGSEWFVIGASAAGIEADYESYARKLEEFVEANKIPSATARQRIAVAMMACGVRENDFIRKTAEEESDKLGIMSRVFGLHLLNNNVAAEKVTKEELTEQILGLRKSDGGWAIMGTTSDVDVTAMVIQALAPLVKENKEVAEAVDGAVEILSGKQLENGGFSGFGNENPESVSQVVIAITSLGIDPLTDERFIKNENTVLDGLLRYRREDGSFAHTIDGDANVSATYQALLALASLKKFKEGRGGLYEFGEAESRTPREQDTAKEVEPTVTEAPTPTVVPTAVIETPAESESRSEASAVDIKTIVIAGTILLGIAASLALFLTGHRNRKNYIFVGGICLLICVLAFFTRFSTRDAYYSGAEGRKAAPVGTVTITIRCDTVKDEADRRYIPEDGVILPVTTYEIEEGDTVYDILVEAVKEHNIQMENRGSSTGAHGMVYIAGIAYLYEQQFGELSGWIYHVNGVAPSYGCGDCVLKDGDVVEWLYTRDLGRDLGENFDDWE